MMFPTSMSTFHLIMVCFAYLGIEANLKVILASKNFRISWNNVVYSLLTSMQVLYILSLILLVFTLKEQTIAYELCQLAHHLFIGNVILINLVIVTFIIRTILVKSLLHNHLTSEVAFQDWRRG